MKRISIGIAVALAVGAGGAQGQDSFDLERAWFRPTLVSGTDAACGDLLAYGNRLVTESVQPVLESSHYVTPLGPPGFEPIDFLRGLPTEGPPELDRRYVETQGTKLYFVNDWNNGCGGACSTQQLYASPTPFPPPGEQREDFLRTLPATPAVSGPRLVRREDRYYADLFHDGALVLMLLEPDGDWTGVCRVNLVPPIPAVSDDAVVRRAKESLEALRVSLRGLTRDAGSCGTMDAHGRRAEYVADALRELLYVPRRPDADRAEDDERYAANLAEWALQGLDENDAYRAYQAQFDATLAELARFYEQRFAAAPADARRWADYGLRTALGTGLAFSKNYGLMTATAERLRTALLEKRPLAEIRAIVASYTLATPASLIDGPPANDDRSEDDPRRGESLLNVAVEYPEALAYFLELGANPSKVNDFGKTPLMYAAQRNAVAAAELLLDAGANPNATTVWPLDSCYYTLRTAAMTPLHYAVRYGSAELVNLLLDRGAATYIRTSKEGIRSETPLDWFRRYTAPGAAERNENIADGEVAQLAERLAVPSAENLAALATRLAFDAEARYAAGDVTTAFDLLHRGLLADDSHTRALSDMSLIALRAGEPGEAAGAAQALIGLNVDARTTANAWFNLGLACSGPDAQYRVQFEQSPPCNFGSPPIYAFLRAWVSEPTAARAEKLRELFASASCRRNADDPLDSYISVQGVVYAYHSAAVVLAAPPALVERHELGERAITVFKTSTPLISRAADCR